jgi:hypothetical protein
MKKDAGRHAVGTVVFLLALVGIVVAYKWFIRTYGRGSEYDTGTGAVEGLGEFEFDIVGESNYQRALRRIAGPKTEDSKRHPCVAMLVLEDDNPHDNMAVRVDIEGETVGYLSRRHARQYRKELERQGITGYRLRAQALIVGGWDRGGGDSGHYGVKLDLPIVE